MSPYTVLGLAEGESDERTIKRAYAKLLKQHRPDQDPEGFTRVHQAYLALTASAVEARPSASLVDEQVTPNEPEQPVQVDGAWDSACMAFTTALEAEPGTARETDLTRAITGLAGMLAEGRGDWQQARRLVVPVVCEQTCRWGETPEPAMVRLLEPYPELIEKRLLFLLKNNHHQQVPGLLTAWIDDLENRRSSADDERAVLLRVMAWCVFVDYRSAARMAAVFSQLYGRQALVHCDLALTAGHEAKDFPPAHVPVLAQVIAGTDRTRSPMVRGVVAYVKALGRQHPVRRLLTLHAPSLMGARGMTDGHAEGGDNSTVMIGVLVSLALGAAFIASQVIFGGPPLFVISGIFVGVWLIAAVVRRLRTWWRQ